MTRISLRFAVLIILFAGCATTSNIKQEDRVTILLKDGTTIKGEVKDISSNTIAFEAIDRKKAYDYGEVIQLDLVRGIRMPNGEILSVKEFDSARKGGDLRTVKKRANARNARVGKGESRKSSESQYDELKSMPINEMTDNEFQFFMMMKEKELEAQESAVTARTNTVAQRSKNSSRKRDEEVNELVDSMARAGVAPQYLGYLKTKAVRRSGLTRFEKEIINLIEADPDWQAQMDDLEYLNRTAKKALRRAYLYNPDELARNLNLSFAIDDEMDYAHLMRQLHRELGEDVQIRDFRTLVDILGESGAGAVKEILENYSMWQLLMTQDAAFVDK